MASQNELLSALEETRAVADQLAAKGVFADSIALREKAVRLQTRLYGNESRQVMDERLSIAEDYTNWALQLLRALNRRSQKENIEDGVTVRKYLTMAEVLTEAHPRMPRGRRLTVRSAVLNALMCASRQLGNLRTARGYARQALHFHRHHGLREPEAESLLNVAAIDSAMHRHEAALANIEAALDVVLDLEEHRCAEESRQLDPSFSAPSHRDKIFYSPLQVICYSDMGVELEHLGRLPEALESYEAAYQLAYMALGPTHKMTGRACAGYAGVHRKLAARTAEALEAAAPKVVIGPEDTLYDLTLLRQSVTQRWASNRPPKRPPVPHKLALYRTTITHSLSVTV